MQTETGLGLLPFLGPVVDCLGNPPLGPDWAPPTKRTGRYQKPKPFSSSIWWGTIARGQADLKQKLTRYFITRKKVLGEQGEIPIRYTQT